MLPITKENTSSRPCRSVTWALPSALLLPTEGIAVTFSVAVAVAVTVQGAARALMLRFA